MTPNNRTNFLWWVLIGPIMILISCTPEPTTIKLNSPEQPQTTVPPISTPRNELPDQSLELLQRIELLEQQLNESQKTQTLQYSTNDNPTTSSNKQITPTMATELSKPKPESPKTANEAAELELDINSHTKPTGTITILNYSSYSTQDISKWVAYAESKMASRKSNILAWIYPVGDMIRPEQEIEDMPFIKHEVVLKNSEIDILMNDIESWLKDDECMGHRDENEHLQDELNRFRAWFEQGADASTQAALCEETRIIAMGITENMREHEPLFNFQDFLIHEFYHAFQQDLAMPGQCERKTRQPGSNTLWFVEGAANYFSQKVVAEIQGSDYPFRSAWDRMLEIAWEVHNMENVTEIDGGPVDKTGAIALRLLIEKGLLTEEEIMDGSLFHNCARELVYDRNSPEIQHVKQSWHLIEHTNDGFQLKAEAYIP
ncbi:MAG: Uncharacterised protein [Chloroflexota bacterium]|nr:MAG: Uncharacterised protein [Chloroflexota bacterium]